MHKLSTPDSLQSACAAMYIHTQCGVRCCMLKFSSMPMHSAQKRVYKQHHFQQSDWCVAGMYLVSYAQHSDSHIPVWLQSP